MSYKFIAIGVLRLADNVSIPDNPKNRDWQQYLKWVAAGGVTQPADPPAPTPTFAEDTQARFDRDQFMRGLIRVLANRFSTTPAQLLDAIKNATD
jgi:hypothetical protein